MTPSKRQVVKAGKKERIQQLLKGLASTRPEPVLCHLASFQYNHTPNNHRMCNVSTAPPIPAAMIDHFMTGVSERRSLKKLANSRN